MKEDTGLRLINTRKLLNIKQKELAASLGLTAASLSAYEKEKKTPLTTLYPGIPYIKD
jgi:transcriptional regulator with XRE-family HTH domain